MAAEAKNIWIPRRSGFARRLAERLHLLRPPSDEVLPLSAEEVEALADHMITQSAQQFEQKLRSAGDARVETSEDAATISAAIASWSTEGPVPARVQALNEAVRVFRRQHGIV